MFHFVWGQLRGRAGRSVALLVGVLVATTGFVVLTGATTTSRLAVTGTVERNTRAAYDILVRPKGTRTHPGSRPRTAGEQLGRSGAGRRSRGLVGFLWS